MDLRVGTRFQQITLAAAFIAIISLGIGFLDTGESVAALPVSRALVVGPIYFEETYFVAGATPERRWPMVGEEFILKARIRNIGPAVIWYLPSLCDSSVSATFDPAYVRVETGRPRCLAASMPTALNPGEETTVWAPESGTAYVAIRAGSTTATVTFTYNTDPDMEDSTRADARSTVPLTIEGAPWNSRIPSFPIESIILGLGLGLGIFLYRRRIKRG